MLCVGSHVNAFTGIASATSVKDSVYAAVFDARTAHKCDNQKGGWKALQIKNLSRLFLTEHFTENHQKHQLKRYPPIAVCLAPRRQPSQCFLYAYDKSRCRLRTDDKRCKK